MLLVKHRVLMVLAPVAVVAGCTSHAGSNAVGFTVTPNTALFDSPVSVRVTGLKPAQTATITTTSKASNGVSWTSSAQYVANDSGTVTSAQSPSAGSYTGANPMGLFESETPGGDPDTPAGFLPGAAWQVTVNLQLGGHVVGAETITRELPHQVGVTAHVLRPPSGGLYGELYSPTDASVRRPAVIVFGGSEGGLSTVAQASLLAAHGYPALALAYFDEPGLPENLENIPLEYFEKALRYLADQPGVDPHRLLVWGDSRGSEAALLVALHYPTLVAGVIGSVPSGVVYGGLPDGNDPAWTYRGAPVRPAPSADFHEVTPSDAPYAVIPVAKINGSIMLVCGGKDEVWPSCSYTDAMRNRLGAAARTPTILKYPQAGHFVGSLLPYVPDTRTGGTTASGVHVSTGGSPAADEAGRADGWPKLLAFIAKTPAD